MSNMSSITFKGLLYDGQHHVHVIFCHTWRHAHLVLQIPRDSSHHLSACNLLVDCSMHTRALDENIVVASVCKALDKETMNCVQDKHRVKTCRGQICDNRIAHRVNMLALPWHMKSPFCAHLWWYLRHKIWSALEILQWTKIKINPKTVILHFKRLLWIGSTSQTAISYKTVWSGLSAKRPVQETTCEEQKHHPVSM